MTNTKITDHNDKNLRFTIPSKSKIDKAGRTLKDPTATEQEIVEAILTLSHWRGLHSHALNSLQAMLIQRAKNYPNSTVAQRLKRLPSILNKLSRLSSRLSQMQDIAGLRVIVETTEQARLFHKNLVRHHSNHEVILPPTDYIENPKESGYRSIHQIFEYRNKSHEELNTLKVEVQIRSLLQHSWATAVETLGAIEHSSFKTGDGSDQFKQFFKLASALISYEENTPILKEFSQRDIRSIVKEFEKLEQDLNIFKKLKSVTIATKNVIGFHKSHYQLLILDTTKEKLDLIPFDKKQADLAETTYSHMEAACKNDPTKLVVLISAGDLQSIQKAYPNYFLDTKYFIDTLRKICAKINKQNNN